ncbi:MAG: class I SAM-dependent methyltransferase [Planctomycetes bacterium]|nr:class I SAM-dependent methyltransferase [Planctomycetota bacterium]MCB9886756.1 class I SAM-dependent methyltransferase [Planctomycetota bacterium]
MSNYSLDRWLERGLLPDWVVRMGIRKLLRERLRLERTDDAEVSAERLRAWVASCDASPIAIDTRAANEQHYEVPAAFYAKVLGRHRKYSSGYWRTDSTTLDEAEAAMLELSCQRAELRDGMRVLDLGCGWGSMALWIARQYPNCEVVGVSNSASQREDILSRANADGLRNVEIVTADVNDFAATGHFDRIVSIEMMEHARNWRLLLERCAGWLLPRGKMFVHVFTHRTVGYPFADAGHDDWMARYFFTGGQMPADAQLLHFQDHLGVEGHWRVNGTHYQRTAEAWLRNFDRHREELRPVLRATYGDRGPAMENLWRVFFLACAELWGYDRGNEWFVSHYRLAKRG